MKTALITWNGRIAPVFDVATEAVVVETKQRSIVGRHVMRLPESDPIDKIIALAEAGVSTLICGAITWSSRNQATTYGITLLPFITGETETVLQAWLADALDRKIFILPGCCGGRGQGQGYGCGQRRCGRKRENRSRF